MLKKEYYEGAISPGDCISNSWALVSQNYGLFFGMSILAFATLFFISCIPFLGIIINGILTGPIYVGIYYALLKKMRGEEINFGMMFFGFERFVPAMIVSLVVMLPYIIFQIFQLFFDFANIFAGRAFGNHYQSNGSLETVLAGIGFAMILFFLFFFLVLIAVNISMFFALPLIAERDLSAVEVMKLSASAAWANLGGIIVLCILEGLIMIAGMLALCFGLFFVLPLIYGANAFAYRQVFPQGEPPPLNTAPPMPNEYGSNFGQGM